MKFAIDFAGFTYTARIFVMCAIQIDSKGFLFFFRIYILAVSSTANAVTLNKNYFSCSGTLPISLPNICQVGMNCV